MAIVKARDARRLSNPELKEKLKELRFELIKSNLVANRTNAKIREIKRTISRLLTISSSGIEKQKPERRGEKK